MKYTEARHKFINDILGKKFVSPVIIGINGIDAVGKSCFSDQLAEDIAKHTDRPLIQTSIDNFTIYRGIREGYKPHLALDADRWYYEDAFPPALVIDTFLNPLHESKGETVRCQKAVFNWGIDAPVEDAFIDVPASAIIILDGVFIFRPELKNYFDFKVFLDGDMDVILQRGLQRAAERGQDVNEIGKGFEHCYYKAQKHYIKTCTPQANVDLWIDNTDYRNPVLKKSNSP